MARRRRNEDPSGNGDPRLEAVAARLLDEVVKHIESMSPAGLDHRVWVHDGGEWLEAALAPALSELTGPGPHDGELVFDIIRVDDVAAVAALFTDPHVCCGQQEPDMVVELTFDGTFQGVETYLRIRFTPFEDAEPTT